MRRRGRACGAEDLCARDAESNTTEDAALGTPVPVRSSTVPCVRQTVPSITGCAALVQHP